MTGTGDRFREEKARDDLAFEPLPPSRWVIVTETGIRIKTPYSEALSKCLRALPGARWDANERIWRLPFTAAPALRRALAQIDELAAAALLTRESEPKWERKPPAKAEKPALLPRLLLSREYLRATSARPNFKLTVEAIGDDVATKYRAYGFRSRNWVAQIFGTDGAGGWQRSFLPGHKSYASANSVGSRGVEVTYHLEEGPIYQIASPLTWRQTDRFFARVVEGALCRMTEEEVIACLDRLD